MAVKNELILTPNIHDPDGFYDALLRKHDDLSMEESNAFNARLILILANHIGDRALLDAALTAAEIETKQAGS